MDTTTETMVTTVTARDRRALLNADSITFHLRDGQGSIRAHRRGERTSSGFDEFHEIYTTTTMRDYDKDAGTSGTRELTAYAAFHMEYSPQYDLPCRSLLARIRTGDTLQLRWTRSNNNENNRNIGWERDELHLGIHHAKGRDEEYLVDVQVGPDNTARMVTRRR